MARHKVRRRMARDNLSVLETGDDIYFITDPRNSKENDRRREVPKENRESEGC